MPAKVRRRRGAPPANGRELAGQNESPLPPIHRSGRFNRGCVKRVDGLRSRTCVKRLEAAGLLRPEIDSTDLRRHRLSLTGDGRKGPTRRMSVIAEAFGQRLARLGEAQQKELQGFVEKLV